MLAVLSFKVLRTKRIRLFLGEKMEFEFSGKGPYFTGSPVPREFFGEVRCVGIIPVPRKTKSTIGGFLSRRGYLLCTPGGLGLHHCVRGHI